MCGGLVCLSASCYSLRNNLARPLDCWREVADFKAAVADIEQVSSGTFSVKLPLNILHRNILILYDSKYYQLSAELS